MHFSVRRCFCTRQGAFPGVGVPGCARKELNGQLQDSSDLEGWEGLRSPKTATESGRGRRRARRAQGENPRNEEHGRGCDRNRTKTNYLLLIINHNITGALLRLSLPGQTPL